MQNLPNLVQSENTMHGRFWVHFHGLFGSQMQNLPKLVQFEKIQLCISPMILCQLQMHYFGQIKLFSICPMILCYITIDAQFKSNLAIYCLPHDFVHILEVQFKSISLFSSCSMILCCIWMHNLSQIQQFCICPIILCYLYLHNFSQNMWSRRSAIKRCPSP